MNPVNHSRSRVGGAGLAGWAALAAIALFAGVGSVRGDDWLRFRGPNGSGISDAPPADDLERIGEPALEDEVAGIRLVQPNRRRFARLRHVLLRLRHGRARSRTRRRVAAAPGLCRSSDGTRSSGPRTIDGGSPEDDFNGYLTEHGYASNTPTSDGERVYVFFGKSGVFAFDLEGKKLWSAHVGKESSDRRWGSAASLILCDDVLIVNASEESNSLRAFDKRTGKQLWKSEAKLLELAYDTPALVTKGGKSDLVIAVPGEVWGLDPNRGKLRWRVETRLIGNICPSPVVDGDRVFVFGGVRSSGSYAIRAG